jgi:hypothetical protein
LALEPEPVVEPAPAVAEPIPEPDPAPAATEKKAAEPVPKASSPQSKPAADPPASNPPPPAASPPPPAVAKPVKPRRPRSGQKEVSAKETAKKEDTGTPSGKLVRTHPPREVVRPVAAPRAGVPAAPDPEEDIRLPVPSSAVVGAREAAEFPAAAGIVAMLVLGLALTGLFVVVVRFIRGTWSP